MDTIKRNFQTLQEFRNTVKKDVLCPHIHAVNLNSKNFQDL